MAVGGATSENRNVSNKAPKRGKNAGEKADAARDDLSEEDLQIQAEIVAQVAIVMDGSASDETTAEALENLATQLRAATASMTSVPKPLKFMRPSFFELAERWISLEAGHNKRYLADILSVLATTKPRAVTTVAPKHQSTEDTAATTTDGSARESSSPKAVTPKSPEKSQKVTSTVITDDVDVPMDDNAVPHTSRRQLALYYRLKGGVTEITEWGQEYLRNLSGDIAAEWNEIQTKTVVTVPRPGGEPGDSRAPAMDSFNAEANAEELTSLVVDSIVPYYVSRNAETDSIDLLMEVESLEHIVNYVDEANYRRIVSYIIATASYAATSADHVKILGVAFDIYLKQKQYDGAARVALKLCDTQRLNTVIKQCRDKLLLKQIAFICFRQRVYPEWGSVLSEEERADSALVTDLLRLSAGEWMTDHYKALALELDVVEAKLPEDVYKTHLEERRVEAPLDSAKQNLAASFVNGFVNAGFGDDQLVSPDDSTWLYKNKEHGIISAAASLGLINLWNINNGLAKTDKLQWSSDPHVKTGAYLAFGIFNATVRSEWDPAFALLNEHVDAEDDSERLGAVLGLGLAFAASRRADVRELLAPLIIDFGQPIHIASAAALSLGLVFTSSCYDDVAEVLVQALLERSLAAAELTAANEIDDLHRSHFCIALGLIFLGRRDACEPILLALEALPTQLREYATVTIEGMAFACSGDVLKVQRMLAACVDVPEEPSEPDESSSVPPVAAADDSGTASVPTSTEFPSSSGPTVKKDAASTEPPQPKPVETPTLPVSSSEGPTATKTTDEPTASAAEVKSNCNQEPITRVVLQREKPCAVLNLSLIAMGESTGSEMVLRLIDHLLQYSSMPCRRAIPLALALHSVSNPRPQIIDTLAKLSHDQDADVALHAILALGIVSAGSNNSRVGGLLRQLAQYYVKDANGLFTVRIAQGLLYLGKGLLTLNPTHSDGLLVDPAALGSLLVVLHVSLNFRKTILARLHPYLYFLVPAIYPRNLTTLDEALEPISVPVRVGQAVDVTGQAGQPRAITGFQTHTTPVLLSTGERAELAEEDYDPVTSILEGVVILRKKQNDVPKQETT